MSNAAVPAAYNLAPTLWLLVFGALLALGPLAWVWRRQRGETPLKRTQALTVLTLFLTFDLVLFGAFTRLTDSGLAVPTGPAATATAARWARRRTLNKPSKPCPPAR